MPEPQISSSELPPIPPKRYFTIGEVSELCAVRPHVLRYWEQEFSQLKPVKRRGNRRYYQHHEVMLIRRIRQLLYEEGFTIVGARNRLMQEGGSELHVVEASPHPEAESQSIDVAAIKRELGEIITLLKS
jgi:DNA-binding transcriptional MerR regulator